MKPHPLVRTLGFCWLFFGPGLQAGQTGGPEAAESEEPGRDAIARKISTDAFPSIVRVERWDPTQGEAVRLSTSAGFFVQEDSPQGEWILTVIPDWRITDTFRIEVGRAIITAKLLARDPLTSLTLLRMTPSEEQARLKLAAKSDRDIGATLYLMDARSSAGQPATVGCLAGREPLGPLAPTLLRINLPLNSGQAGSPIFNPEGTVTGVVCRPLPDVPDAVLAIPAELLTKFVADVKRYGRPAQPSLGIVVNDHVLSPRLEGVGLDSPAHEAGLESGDIIVTLDGKDISSLQDLVDATHLLYLDRAVEVKVLRGQVIKPFKITARLKQ